MGWNALVAPFGQEGRLYHATMPSVRHEFSTASAESESKQLTIGASLTQPVLAIRVSGYWKDLPSLATAQSSDAAYKTSGNPAAIHRASCQFGNGLRLERRNWSMRSRMIRRLR